MQIALVTATGVAVSELDDRFLVQALSARDVEVAVVRWDDPLVDWRRFDAVCLRSCWDYVRRYDEFVMWLDRVDRAGARWTNPARAVLWNSHKRYLLDLRDAGVPVAPLRLVSQGERFDTIRFLAETDWPDVVIMPAVSASAYRTWLASGSTPEESAARVAEIHAGGDVILQRFVPEIGVGEWSLVFVDGEISHTVLKRPAPGEFRSQPEFGGSITAQAPPRGIADVARSALSVAARHGDPCLVRIDLVDADGGPLVMEVELIEPVLFFEYAPGSADRAADALLQRVRASATRA
jgi:glutathione synthase/RimK-type ligase-like ATP-grasp enzyme